MIKAIMRCYIGPGMFSSERYIEFMAMHNGEGPVTTEELVYEGICHPNGIDVCILEKKDDYSLVSFASQLAMSVVKHQVPNDSLIFSCGN